MIIEGKDDAANPTHASRLFGHSIRTGAAAVGVAGVALVLTLGSSLRFNRLFARGEPQNRSVARERAGELTMNVSEKATAGLPPGSYTRETLPPPGPEVKAILERASAKAQELKSRRADRELGSDQTADNSHLVLSNPGKPKIIITNPGKRRLRGLD